MQSVSQSIPDPCPHVPSYYPNSSSFHGEIPGRGTNNTIDPPRLSSLLLLFALWFTIFNSWNHRSSQCTYYHYPLSAKWSSQLLVCVLTSHDSPHWYACRNGIWPLINLSALQISIVQLQWNWRFLFSYETILSSATLIDKKERECPNCNWTRTLFTFLVLLPKTFVVRVLTDQSRGTNDLILSRLV